MKTSGLFTWFPHPSSWLSALLLSILMTGFVSIIKPNDSWLLNLGRWSDRPEQLTIMVILLLILPIPIIAFFHHFFISRLIPAIPGEKISKTFGLIPGLISWWESLYTWLVLVLSTLSATLFCTPLLPIFNLNYKTIIGINNQPHKNIQITFALVWLVMAAIFYQIEYLVKLRLVFGEPISTEESKSNDIAVDKQPETITGETNVTQIQSTEQTVTKKPNLSDVIVKHRKLPKRIFTLVLISLVSLWLYMFAKLPQVKQTISTNLAIENPPSATLQSSKVTSSPTPNATPDDDTFERAVKKAKRAAKLTKTAQSKDEWQVVLNKWQEAIKLMEEVPSSNPYYSLAQEKLLQYQIHREFAKQNVITGELGR